jgi:octaprenyl-diphosphate synthase
VLDKFKIHFERIDKALKENLHTDVKLAKEIGEYLLLAEGKRLRPLLFVLSARMFGYQKDDIYDLSVVFEYIHTASLLHDDVLDNADTRRKKPSVNSLWGNSAAVLGGDFLYSTSFKIAVKNGNHEFMKLLTDTTKRMAEGQILELIHANNLDITKDEYIQIVLGKTATLISSACACGALIVGAEDGVVENLSNFGLNMGIAFQIMDDLLDYTSSQTEMGKPVGKDLREGKITLPLIYALEEMEEEQINNLKERFKQDIMVEKDYNELVKCVQNSSTVLGRVKEDVEHYTTKARGYLDDMPDTQEKRDLLELNNFISEREY